MTFLLLKNKAVIQWSEIKDEKVLRVNVGWREKYFQK